MDPNKKSSEQPCVNNDRINLNDYNRKDEGEALKNHSDQSRETVDRNLDEQMGAPDDTVTGEPNNF